MWKGKGSTWRDGKQEPKGDNSQRWNDAKDFSKPHPGSISIDVIKASAEYADRYISDAPKKKYCVCLGYLGTEYQGLQINPDAVTVESILEKALFLAGGMDELNFGNLQKLQWSRAARTDRGVHAVSQCCAMKLKIALDADPQNPVKRDEFIRSINQFLPSDIRVLAITRVTKNFNAKMFCSKRRYQYYLPTYLLSPIADMNVILAEAFERQGPVKGAGCLGGFSEPGVVNYLGAEYLAQVWDRVKGYRAPSEQLDTFRSVLARYAGTNSYHNFTTGKTPNDANAKRFIVSFDCSPAEVDAVTGVEWVLLSVVGQSFLLNQIRKMVGYAVDVTRGAVGVDTLSVVFTSQKMDVPMAPGQGLYLDELYFDGYNMKMGKVNETAALITERKAKEETEKKEKLAAVAHAVSSSSSSSSPSEMAMELAAASESKNEANVDNASVARDKGGKDDEDDGAVRLVNHLSLFAYWHY